MLAQGGAGLQQEAFIVSQKRSWIAGAALALLAGQGSAYVTTGYSGVDKNGDPFAALTSIPNASAAESNFKAGLLASSLVDALGSEDFESRPLGPAAQLPLALGSAGTVTLLSPPGAVAGVVPGSTNGFGRYSVPGGTRFWDTQAGGASSFDVRFDRNMAGFGFYGVDIGDLNSTLGLVMYDADDREISRLQVPVAASPTDADGSVLYFGFIAQNSGEFFRRISFVQSGNLVDGFAVDSLTVGSARQPGTIPEPGMLTLVAAAMLGLRRWRAGQTASAPAA